MIVEPVMDAASVSAYAAGAAAIAAAAVAAIQLFVGYRLSKAALQSAQAAQMNAESAGRHTQAEFRQAWIYKVMDAITEHNAIVATHSVASDPADRRKLASVRSRLQILLNPNEEDHVALLAELEKLANGSQESSGSLDDEEMLSKARLVLKREWDRIKNELG
jgi:hypothetical protein